MGSGLSTAEAAASSSFGKEHREALFRHVIEEFNMYDKYLKEEENRLSEEIGNEEDHIIDGDGEDGLLSPRSRVIKDLSGPVLRAERAAKLASKVIFVPLVDLEGAFEAAFRSEKTPVILDSSPDDRVCTFFSYQPDVVTFNAKSMVIAGSKALTKNMEELRKNLVVCMKNGKTLHIRLGSSCPNFRTGFCDEAAKQKIVDPEFYGEIDTELKGSWLRIKDKLPSDVGVLEEAARARDESLDLSLYTHDGHMHGQNPSTMDQKAYFPLLTLRKCGICLYYGQDYWG